MLKSDLLIMVLVMQTSTYLTYVSIDRIKSGNPGYFVVYNPSDELVNADFTDAKGIPEQLTVNLFSKNYNVEKIEKK